MKVLVLFSLVAVAFAVPNCPANTHYKECGTACPLTCENHKNPPTFCVLMCNPGCHCDEGYVRVEKDVEKCIKPTECPNHAPEKNCDDKPDEGPCYADFPAYYYDKETDTCKKFSYGGCKGNGNRYSSEEECVINCAKECVEHSRYHICGSACPVTCENYLEPRKECVNPCVPGCQCDPGFVKAKNGRCVRPEKCPGTEVEECVEHSRYHICGSACPVTCENYRQPRKECVNPCVPGCQCDPGFVKAKNGRCVRPEKCPGTKDD